MSSTRALDALTFGPQPLLVSGPRQCTIKPTSSELDFYALCSEINDLNWTCLLPLELFCRILDLLPTCYLVRASCVCRRWRAIALNTPTLWTHVVVIVDYKRKREDLWAPALEVLLSRSCELPLSLFLWVVDIAAEGTVPSAESAVAMLLQMYLYRIRSLYLMIPGSEPVIPGSEPHDYWFWDDFLRTPAPVLERFSLASVYDNVSYLEDNFLGYCSPRLRELHLHGCEIYDEFPVLESVRTLNYHTISCVDAELAAIAASMPNLRELVLPNWASWGAGEQYEPATGAARFDQELDVRIFTGLPKDLAESYFTRPKSISWASTAAFEEEVVSPIFQCGDIRDLDIRWTTYVAHYHKSDSSCLAIRCNGVLRAVDVSVKMVRKYLTTRSAGVLETLVIPEEFWGRFAVIETPRLQQLTIFVHSCDNYALSSPAFCPALLPTVPARKPLSMLRVAHADVAGTNTSTEPRTTHRTYPLPAKLLEQFIRLVSSTGRVETLVLRDFTLLGPGIHELMQAVGRVRYEDSCYCNGPEDVVERWEWEFPEYGALTL